MGASASLLITTENSSPKTQKHLTTEIDSDLPLPFPKLGVCLSFYPLFVEECGGRL